MNSAPEAYLKCFVCQGVGHIDLHNKDGKYDERPCGRCNGTGKFKRMP